MTSRITSEAVNRAMDYILKHLNEDLSLEQVADHCHFSKYYFSRLFKAQTGESVWEFVQRVRLEQSAFRLSYGGQGVSVYGAGYLSADKVSL